MKTEIKDYLLSALSITLLLVITTLLVYHLTPTIFFLLAEFAPLVDILLFLMIYGFMSTLYLRTMNHLYPLREGIYEMKDTQFTLWKHYAVVGELGKLALKLFFPVFLRPIYYSLLGSKIGRGVAIAGAIADPMLLTIDNFGVLGHDSVVTSHTMIQNKFYLKPVLIGKGATVGINAVIMPGVVLGENSVVAPGAVVLMGTIIPANEFWGGVPARKLKDVAPI